MSNCLLFTYKSTIFFSPLTLYHITSQLCNSLWYQVFFFVKKYYPTTIKFQKSCNLEILLTLFYKENQCSNSYSFVVVIIKFYICIHTHKSKLGFRFFKNFFFFLSSIIIMRDKRFELTFSLKIYPLIQDPWKLGFGCSTSLGALG